MKRCVFCRELPTKYACPQRAPYHWPQPEHHNVICQCGARGPDAPTAEEAEAAWDRGAELLNVLARVRTWTKRSRDVPLAIIEAVEEAVQ
jgi:hypothetical protein